MKSNTPPILIALTKIAGILFKSFALGIQKLKKCDLADYGLILSFAFLPVLLSWKVQLLPTIPWATSSLILASGALYLLFCSMGMKDFWTLSQYQQGLDLVGIHVGDAARPKVVKIINSDPYRTQVVVSSRALGVDRYESKWKDLEATFGQVIDSIKSGSNPKFVLINLCKRKLSNVFPFAEHAPTLKNPYSFLIGESMAGNISKSIVELPHMLIAGTTGGGKSVFFKQVLLGLLKSSEYLQLYLLDLKRGVEMQDFRPLPNVKVAKNEAQALTILKKIKDEMDRRFIYLEEKGLREISPKRDKMDRIVVGVDEASVIYTHSRSNKGKNLRAHQCRELTDEIAKLGRAAGIHLILATQKVTKETIDTKVQENIGGRMCFRVNTLQGSMTVLGNKMAYELPDVKGRAIWATGHEFLEVQAPFLSQEELTEEVQAIEREYTSKNRKLLGRMLSIEEDAKTSTFDEEMDQSQSNG